MSDAIKKKLDEEMYGSFFLGMSEFSLSVKSIQEVVNTPNAFIQVPLAPKYVLGLFNLRGTIMPVVDLAALLRLSADSSIPLAQKKIAIIELGALNVGLLFDRTGELFRAKPEEKSDFDRSLESGASLVVSGAFKLDDGKRIIQILDAEALFKVENLPLEGATDGQQNHARRKKASHRGVKKQAISFVVGSSKCALNIDQIQEIIKIEKVTESALSHSSCIGTIDLRGSVVPVIDFPALLKYREPDRTPNATAGERRILIVRNAEELCGLLVDSVDSIVSFFSEELVSFPVLGNGNKKMFTGCISLEGSEDILLLDSAHLISDADIRAITRGHSNLFKVADAEKNKKGKGQRRTVITFSVENHYAVPIEEIREIIDCSKKDLLQPPGMPPYVIGVLNLRGTMIAIVNTRALYNLGQTNEELSSKVLIFQKNGATCGLVVDNVESILTYHEESKVKLPSLLYKDGSGTISEDVGEALEVELRPGSKVTLMILDLGAVSKRVGVQAAA